MSEQTVAVEPVVAAMRRSFPIVGVGASAGGLAPTVELVRGLGPQPGIAVVIVHHLDPNHESGLVEILSRATTMPVEAAADGVALQPNHVYVVPPNAGLLISQGILEVVARTSEGGRHLPINQFFESLALDRTVLAIGVVLSGSGFDGTEGVKALKREGGIALAQDATAQYASLEAFVDRDRLEQALGNLVGNAIKFTPEGGHIEVVARAEAAGLVIEVTDNGAGISPESMPRLFDRFWQGAHARRAGAGLGLAIAKGMVEAHGGELSVKSELGNGTTFTLAIPGEPASSR